MASNARHDVIIAGAGPIGLFLACELAMRNVSVLVLERDAHPSNPWYVAPTPNTNKALANHTQPHLGSEHPSASAV
jgi:2-polyprenyl-6-methoxyphenol hydroxylase-like FAD-dependent oxidoreductase